MSRTEVGGVGEWRSDYWGSVNQSSAEALAGTIELLDMMGTEPTFQNARRMLLRDLGLIPGVSVLEAGCGPGTALADLVELLGPRGRVAGIDPTVAFIATARGRAAQVGASNARYEVGDLRAIPFEDNAFDAAFCDKVLVHVGPTAVALSELVRVTRPGGRVGALEHQLSHLVLSTTRPDLWARLNVEMSRTRYDSTVGVNLARHFHAAGLVDVQTQAVLGQVRSLDEHPFWRRNLNGNVRGAVAAGTLTPEEGATLMADLEELHTRGEFNLCFLLQTAVGTKPA